MTRNQVFRIVFGPYDLAVDRTTLQLRLAETETGTVWAEDLPVGWVELEDRETGQVARFDFGQATPFSLSERAGAQGKEILFGLDCAGVPIDVYLTCRETEIQLTVEANRDSKTHRVAAFGLLPGLCAIPEDGVSYLVVPVAEGFIALARDVPDDPQDFPVWGGLKMPFIGAVRGKDARRSALALLTDSAYASARRTRTENGGAALDWVYARDLERRRLDLRVVLLPGGDPVTIARAYRDKIIGENNHVTLRRKARERPALDHLFGGALIEFGASSSGEIVRIARDLRAEIGVERGVCALAEATDAADLRDAFPAIRELGYLAGIAVTGIRERLEPRLWEIEALREPDVWLDITQVGLPLSEVSGLGLSRWDEMDGRMRSIRRYGERGALFGSAYGNDWSAVACDFWVRAFASEPFEDSLRNNKTAFVPLHAVVYHDSVVSYGAPLTPQRPSHFLRSLLMLSPPIYHLESAAYFDAATGIREYVRRTYAVLAPLHRLTFPAFLVAHRFLAPDFTVEEARTSNGARVLVNQGDAPFENDELTLPPGGFLAEHPQFVAHDAIRYAGETFAARAWRIARSRDGKPLAESADVERLEFPG